MATKKSNVTDCGGRKLPAQMTNKKPNVSKSNKSKKK